MKNKTKEPKLTREEGCVLEVLPNKEQIIQFQKSFGCARFVYNHFLDMRINLYKYAYNRFFENVKMRRKPYGFPKFKSKRKSKKSYSTKFTNNNIQINLEEKKIKLQTFFFIALTVHNYLGHRQYILLMEILSNVF